MNNYKSYSELQEELGENYPFKLYEMGISALKEIERLEQELKRKDNIINKLKEWLDKEKENYNLELTKKNANALSYSLPIKSVYREVLDKIKDIENEHK